MNPENVMIGGMAFNRAIGGGDVCGQQQSQQPADPWVHRSSGMRCATCIWFVPKMPRNDGPVIKTAEIGRCRRHAPTMGGYPVVYMTDWCGDHRLDENKV